jgi:hypothetical protein
VLFNRTGRIKLGITNILTRLKACEVTNLQDEMAEDLRQVGIIGMCCLVGETESKLGSAVEAMLEPKSHFQKIIQLRRVSSSLQSLVHDCLMARHPAKELLNHKAFTESTKNIVASISPLYRNDLEIPELLKISNNWITGCASEFSQRQLEKICQIIEVVLTRCSKWYLCFLRQVR